MLALISALSGTCKSWEQRVRNVFRVVKVNVYTLKGNVL